MEAVRRKLGFEYGFYVEPAVCSGSLAFLWNVESQLELYNYYLRHISGWIRGSKSDLELVVH